MPSGLEALPCRVLPFAGGAREELADCRPVVVGRQIEAEPTRFHWRNHDREPAWVVHYTIAGVGVVRDDDRGGVEHEVPAGCAFAVPFPSRTSYYRPRGARWDFCWLLATGRMVEDHGRRLLTAHGPLWTLVAGSPALRALRELAALALSGGGDAADSSAACYRLICEMWRAHRVPQSPPADIAAACALALRRLDDATLGVDAMAREAGVSPAHFSRRFRHHLGASPYAWLVERRLEHALEAIASGRASLRRAASDAGFGSYAHFCNRFRRRYRMTPSAVAAPREPRR